MRGLILLLSALLCSSLSIAQQNVDSAQLPKGWWLIPKTSTRFKVGGYVKADLIHDFKPIESPDFFDVSKIPTDGSEGQTSHFNLKETRLLLDVRTPTKMGDVRAYVEGDFYGSGSSFRIRHALIELGDHWMVGQYWSNFMDEDIIPNTLDFEKPGAYAFIRHGMLRYKAKLSKGSFLAIALEEPGTNAVAPSTPGKYTAPLPDLSARYRITGKWGHVQLSAFTGLLKYEYTNGGDKNIWLFGANLSGRLNVLKKDYLIYQIVGGPGSGRYRSGLSAAPDDNQEIKPLNDLGFTAGFCHYWTPRLSSLFVYNGGKVDNTSGQASNSIKQVNYWAANLLWQMFDHTMVGVEYMNGKRTDKDEATGTANRIQMSIKHSFNL